MVWWFGGSSRMDWLCFVLEHGGICFAIDGSL